MVVLSLLLMQSLSEEEHCCRKGGAMCGSFGAKHFSAGAA